MSTSILRMAIQMLRCFPSGSEQLDDKDMAVVVYSLCNILSDQSSVDARVFGLACCCCAWLISPTELAQGTSILDMTVEELASVCFSSDESETLSCMLQMLNGSDRFLTFSLTDEDKYLVSHTRDTLWRKNSENLQIESYIISEFSSAPEWDELSRYMAMDPIEAFQFHPLNSENEQLGPQNSSRLQLIQSSFGVAKVHGLFSLMNRASPWRPGFHVSEETNLDSQIDWDQTEWDRMLLKDIFSFQDISRKWMEGSCSVICRCHHCTTTVVGCNRRSVLHVKGLLYSRVESDSSAFGPDVVVPLDRLIWRVSWKAHLYDPKKAATSVNTLGCLRDISHLSSPDCLGALFMSDEWVHLDVQAETISAISQFCKARGGGHAGFVFCPGTPDLKLHAVVLSSLPGDQYDVLVQGRGSMLYEGSEIRGMTTDTGSDLGHMSIAKPIII